MDIAEQLNRFLKPLVSRVRNLASRGVVKRVDDGAKLQRIQASLLAGELKDGLEHYQNYGFTSHAPASSEILAVFPAGDRSNGVVVAVGDRRFRLKDLASGEVALYTDEGDYVRFCRGRVMNVMTKTLNVDAATAVNVAAGPVTVNSSGSVAVAAASSVTVSAGEITLSASSAVTVTAPVFAVNAAAMAFGGEGGGTSTFTGSIIGTNGDITADGVSLKRHVHSGVEPGSGTTGAPS